MGNENDFNSTTINSYNTHIEEYISGTPQEVSGRVKDWILESIAGMPLDSRILEIGSAFGRDARFIETLGYKVSRTDATQKFVQYLNDNGYVAHLLNVLTDEISGNFDLIFANAVLLHFTRVEATTVIKKFFNALSTGGRFACRLKEGIGEEWSDEKLGAPRFYCYWNQDSIIKVVKNIGFEIFQIETDTNLSSGVSWIDFIAVKP